MADLVNETLQQVLDGAAPSMDAPRPLKKARWEPSLMSAAAAPEMLLEAGSTASRSRNVSSGYVACAPLQQPPYNHLIYKPPNKRFQPIVLDKRLMDF